MDPPYEVPCEIAVDRSTSSVFKLLSCCLQFLNFSRNVTMDPSEVLTERREIASEEGETSSKAISKSDYQVFSGKATVDSCEVIPKRHEIAPEEGEPSSAISKNDYEVFLSFRGPDTRQGFTDCLYHAMVDAGIRVFRDDDELALGDKIDGILTALDNSKICIVVISPTFAASAWCLREVERMVGMKKDIVPIFYCVTPDDVKLKTELYANALTMHENKYGKERVQLWREALKEIPTIKGRALKNTGFVEFGRKIAKEILTKLKVKNKYEIDNLVQVEDEVEAALKLLDTGSGGCRFLAIHGMGGIGKTTLAKIIFNQISDSFDCSCFLENIRENLSQPGGLQKLQEQLLRSIDPSLRDAAHIFDAIRQIKNNFTRKKVFMVLDDIDHKNHIRDLVGSFGSGSRIIFTTRNAELHKQETSLDANFYGLEKKEMDSEQAIKLFSRHAFGHDFPPEDFESLSAEVISTTAGLPLALEVVGSFLHRRKAKVWRDMIKKLKEAPHEDVQARLKISYNALDYEQQEIFLDIACFFIGEEKRNVVYMWEACEFDPNYGIEVLISMSLIKLKEVKQYSLNEDKKYSWKDKSNEKKCFWMHDQLRDLGRAIVKVNSKDDRAGSRLWMHKEAVDLLNANVGKEKVEALNLHGPRISLDRENFVGLKELRYLQSSYCADLGGDFGGLFPKLRWLSLLSSNISVTNLCLREVVVLNLSWCLFDETWQGWGQILISKQLKVLTLKGCNDLTSVPDLSEIVNLERLSLIDCGKLTSIHSSVGKLQCLRSLRIKGCRILHELPESIGGLVSLTRLELEGAPNLPNSIGKLVKLKHLSLRNCEHLRVLPDSIGDLRLLISLDLHELGIAELPSTIGRLTKLESLWLNQCWKLKRLPDSIGNLHSLIDLDMSGTDIVELPDSFGNLASLQTLDLSGSSVRSFPDSFRGLEKLERLVIGYRCCIRLRTIPIGFTSLEIGCVAVDKEGSSHFNFLRIDNLEGNIPLDGIKKLIKLEELSIQCYGGYSYPLEWGVLQQLKSLTIECGDVDFGECQLPLSLESLNLKVSKKSRLPVNFSSLKNLTKVRLCNFVIEEADSIGGLESLEYLCMTECILKFIGFPVLNKLEYLDISTCQIKLSNLENLLELSLTATDDKKLEEDLTTLSVLENLSELWQAVTDDGKLEDLISGFKPVELSDLMNLSKLSLCYFWINEERFKVEGLESLVDLHLSHCIISELSSVSLFKCLRSIRLQSCSFPTRCLHMPHLDHLVELNIGCCMDLVDIQGIGKLKSLTKLNIDCCDSLRRIEDLFELNGLKYICIGLCSKFEGIDGIDRLLSAGTLSRLTIANCKCKDVRYQSRFVEVGLEE